MPAAQQAPTSAELRDFLGNQLPDYMVPVCFVTLDSLPMTPSGKVDRARLPRPSLSRDDSGASYRAPGNPVEEKIASIYEEALHLDRAGVDDDFFRLGGHSLLATRIISRIRDVFQIELPLRSVFVAPTVRKLAAVVVAEASAAVRNRRIPRRREVGTCPLSSGQQRLLVSRSASVRFSGIQHRQGSAVARQPGHAGVGARNQ